MLCWWCARRVQGPNGTSEVVAAPIRAGVPVRAPQVVQALTGALAKAGQLLKAEVLAKLEVPAKRGALAKAGAPDRTLVFALAPNRPTNVIRDRAPVMQRRGAAATTRSPTQCPQSALRSDPETRFRREHSWTTPSRFNRLRRHTTGGRSSSAGNVESRPRPRMRRHPHCDCAV